LNFDVYKYAPAMKISYKTVPIWKLVIDRPSRTESGRDVPYKRTEDIRQLWKRTLLWQSARVVRLSEL
jgi:hypothetical protein